SGVDLDKADAVTRQHPPVRADSVAERVDNERAIHGAVLDDHGHFEVQGQRMRNALQKKQGKKGQHSSWRHGKRIKVLTLLHEAANYTPNVLLQPDLISNGELQSQVVGSEWREIGQHPGNCGGDKNGCHDENPHIVVKWGEDVPQFRTRGRSRHQNSVGLLEESSSKADFLVEAAHHFDALRVEVTGGRVERDHSSLRIDGRPRAPHLQRIAGSVADIERRLSDRIVQCLRQSLDCINESSVQCLQLSEFSEFQRCSFHIDHFHSSQLCSTVSLLTRIQSVSQLSNTSRTGAEHDPGTLIPVVPPLTRATFEFEMMCTAGSGVDLDKADAVTRQHPPVRADSVAERVDNERAIHGPVVLDDHGHFEVQGQRMRNTLQQDKVPDDISWFFGNQRPMKHWGKCKPGRTSESLSTSTSISPIESRKGRSRRRLTQTSSEDLESAVACTLVPTALRPSSEPSRSTELVPVVDIQKQQAVQEPVEVQAEPPLRRSIDHADQFNAMAHDLGHVARLAKPGLRARRGSSPIGVTGRPASHPPTGLTVKMHRGTRAFLLHFILLQCVTNSLSLNFKVAVVVENNGAVNRSLIVNAFSHRVSSNWRVLAGHSISFVEINATSCSATQIVKSMCEQTGLSGVIAVGQCSTLMQISAATKTMQLPLISLPSGICKEQYSSTDYSVFGMHDPLHMVNAAVKTMAAKSASEVVIFFDSKQRIMVLQDLQNSFTKHGISSLTFQVDTNSGALVTDLNAHMTRLLKKKVFHMLVLAEPANVFAILDHANASLVMQQNYFWLIIDTGIAKGQIRHHIISNSNVALVRGGTTGINVPGSCSAPVRDVFDSCDTDWIRTLDTRFVDAVEALAKALNDAVTESTFNVSNAACNPLQVWSSGPSVYSKLTSMSGYNSNRGVISFNSTTGHFDSQGIEVVGSFNQKLSSPIQFIQSGMYNTQSGALSVLFREKGTVLVGGMLKDVLDILAARLDFRYSVKVPDDGQWGGPQAGRSYFSGCVGEVQRGIVSIGGSTFTKSTTRDGVVDFSTPLFQEAYGILVPRPPPESKLWNVYAPFKYDVWILVIIFIFVSAAVTWVLAYFSPFTAYNLRLEFAFADEIWLQEYIWSIVGSFMQQGQDFYPFAMSPRAVLAFWWMFTVIIYGTYTGDLTAHLTISFTDLPIKTLSDLVAQSAVKPLVPEGTNLYNLLTTSTGGVYRQVADKLQISDTIPECIEQTFQGKEACLTDYTALLYAARANCSKVYIADEIFNSATVAFMYPEDAYFGANIDFQFQKMHETGIMQKLFNTYWSSDAVCSTGSFAEADSINLEGSGGCFIVALALYSLGLLTLLVELLWTKALKRHPLDCVHQSDATCGSSDQRSVRQQKGRAVWAEEFLFAEGQSVAKFFTAEQRQFFRKQPNGQECVIERSVVFCRDVYAFLAHVSNSRGTAEMHQRVKLAIDGGGNSLKVCVSVTVDDRGCTSSAQFNRFMDSGVKKILILALVEDVKECYQNVSVLMSTIDISSINFTLACDFKLANIISGIQSHSSSHPCLYCEGRPPWEVPAQRGTLGSIRHLASEFQAAGGHQPLAKNFANCVQPPLLPGSDSAELLDVVPPPELHMMLGILGGNKAYEWAYEAGICRQQYHGGCLEGPACKKLLLKASELWSVLPPHLKLYATALQDFNAVREACFGQSLAADYSLYIARFQTTCRYLELSVTPKMHALFDHVPAFCGKYGKGLGSFSEQAVESAHTRGMATNYIALPPPPEPFVISDDPHNAGKRWREWAARFTDFIEASGVANENQKCKLLCYTAGKEVSDIVRELPKPQVEGEEKEHTLASIFDGLKRHFDDRKNIVFARYQFRLCIQQAGEKIEAWHSRLRAAAEPCEFENLRDSLIRDQLVATCTSDKLRRRLLQEADITLEDALRKARAFEAAEEQAAEMEKTTDAQVASLARSSKTATDRRGPASEPRSKPSQMNTCYRCGERGHATCDAARGRICNNCGKPNHLAKACRQPRSAGSRARQQIHANADCTVPDAVASEDVFTLHRNGTYPAEVSLKVQRMALRIQHLRFTLLYRPGPANPADLLSRQPLPELRPNIGEVIDAA
uniref:CCHC-type domain-containing protein n=1 Tax=Macrostomum lignano TaxID=282301 RepID=A0A1I8HAM9_9PLAT